MTTTIGELISQIRNQTKSVHADNRYISDRLVFSLIKKHLALLLFREDSKMRLTALRFLYSLIPFLELVEVDKVEAGCAGIRSGCTIKRTKELLPPMLKGFSGPLIGQVSSLDGSVELQVTTPGAYLKKMNASDARYNRTLYYWYLNGYLYFPNLEWDAVRLEAVLEDEVDGCGQVNPCQTAQEMRFSAPDYLISSVQAEVLKDLTFMLQVPTDTVVDKQSITR